MSFFKTIDFRLADFIFEERCDPNVKKLVAYLSAALREGYPSIQISENITPPPEALWDGESSLLSEEKINLIESLKNGFDHLKRMAHPPQLILEGNSLFFELYHFLNNRFKELYKNLLSTPPTLKIDPAAAKEAILKLQHEKMITSEQAEAIYKGCTQNITLISGGPGTGKTYAAGILLKTFYDLLKGHPCKIALAAPTGKAAANLEKSLKKFCHSVEGLKDLKATTLHSLLQLGRKGDRQQIEADLILIDESSMIDTKRMVALMEAIKPGTQLILMGDPNQLPPVEVGALFAEMIHSRSDGVCLKKCQRTDMAEIVEMSQAILEGRCEGVRFHTNPEPFLDQAVEEYTPPTDLSEDELLHFFSNYRILSPLNKGPWGCETINAEIYKRISLRYKNPVIPILITKNDSALTLSNGDIGIVIEKHAFFPGKELIKIPAIALPENSLAYCLSVHKSQGSEFDKILLLWPEGAQRFGRPGLYTGVTRARKKVDLICTSETLKATLN